MSSAAADIDGTAASARGHDSADHLTTATTAVPGAESVAYVQDLGNGWRDEVDDWADDVESFAAAVGGSGRDASGSDASSGGLFGGLLRFLGAGR